VGVVANVGINVDSRGAQNKLRQLDSQANKTQQAFKNLGAAAAKVAGALALVGAAKFVFVKTAELEKQTKSLEVLTGSLEKAKGVIKELQEFGAQTPFTSAELIETAKRLKAFGVSTEDLVETTKRLGDVAGATSAELSGIATAYGQIQAKGKLQTEELLQLQERGVDIATVLKKEYKLTGEEFSKALQKGQISAEAVQFALQELTKTGGQYADGAIAQSVTLSGKLSTIQDNIETLARTLGQVLAPVIRDVFDQAIAALDVINRLLAAGRAGGFNRAIGGIGTALTFGASSEALDRAEKFLGQVSSQKNKTGILQNVQALDQLSRAISRVRPEDVNAGRAVRLQGEILRLRQANIEALQQLKPETLPEIKIPELLIGTSSKGKAKGRARKTPKEREDISLGVYELELKRLQARKEGNKLQEIFYSKELETLKIIEQQLKPREEELRLLLAEQDALEAAGELLIPIYEGAQELQKAATDAGKAFAEMFIEADNARLLEQAQQMYQIYDQIGQTISSGIVDALTSAVEGTKTLGEVATDVLKNIANLLLNTGINLLMGSAGGGGLLGALFPKLLGRANGGPVTSSTPYMVGERGPELFVPRSSGTIIPNDKMMGGSSNVVVNVDASGTKVQGDNNQASQLGKVIGAAVQAELIKQKRPGGLLAGT
jgi:tape measure domain-containing protein